jgi:hypothetical protein
VDCVDENADGSFTAFFGYRNDNAIAVDIPYGKSTNYLPADIAGARPAEFEAGDHPSDFWIDFKRGQQLVWKLNPPSGPTTEVRASAKSPRCSEDSLGASCLRACRAELAATCDPPITGRGSLDDCYASCVQTTDFLSAECVPEYVAINRCTAAQDPKDPSAWACFDGAVPAPLGCDAQWADLSHCMGWDAP